MASAADHFGERGVEGKMGDFRHGLLALIDAANGALDRHDGTTAAEKYASASELLFRQVAACNCVEEKVALSHRAQQLLVTASALRGETSAAEAVVRPTAPLPAMSHGPSTLPGDAPGPADDGHRLKTGVTFADIAGLEDVKETLRLRVIYPMKSPEKMAHYGLQMGGGMLLFGPPGTGKTMVAKAVAGELALPFFPVLPSQILSQYYGQSEKQMAVLFDEARSHRPGAVIFLDEIDGIGASRNRDGASEPSRRLLNQLLQELDGIHGRPAGMLFLAATNDPWLLDEALLRPPRFTEKCYIPLPDAPGRRVLLQLRLRDCPLAPGIDLERFVARTDGYSGADLVNLCERAKLIPYRESVLNGIDRPLGESDFDEALRRVRPSVSAESVRRYEQWAQKN